MTKQGYTHVLMIIDRSGSMQSIREETENGVNTYIKDQATQPGECRFTVVQFDNTYEVVHADLAAAEVPPYVLDPRAMTALYDAIGRGATELGLALAAKPEDQRPDKVVVVILTDGYENASQEYTPGSIKEMIERQTNDYSWTFTFLGANQDAILEAGKIGITRDAALTYAGQNVKAAFAVASASTSTLRSGGGYGYSAGDRARAMGTPDFDSDDDQTNT